MRAASFGRLYSFYLALRVPSRIHNRAQPRDSAPALFRHHFSLFASLAMTPPYSHFLIAQAAKSDTYFHLPSC